MSIVCGELKVGQCSLFLCGMSLCGLCWKACWDLEDRPAGRGKGEQQGQLEVMLLTAGSQTLWPTIQVTMAKVG